MKLLVAVLAITACSDPTAKPDAAVVIDAPKAIDGKAVDAGACGADVPFTGELIDWDSTESTFCGVFGPTWTVRGSTNPVETKTSSAPNGRVVMCIPNQLATTIDITMPTANSQCTTPASTYPIRGVALVSSAIENALPATDIFSARAFTIARQASLGVALDPTKGGLFVHVVGGPKAVSISSTHDAAQAFDGTAWMVGATGTDVYFPNVPVGTTTLTAPGVTGGAVTIEANAVVYVTLAAT